MDFVQVDVFAEGPYAGNPLAVFADAGSLHTHQMQAIASEMNLSETSFVTAVSADAYDVRIFTAQDEVPFAGHPTVGTAWTLRHLGLVTGDELVQRSGAGETEVFVQGDSASFLRSGRSEPDLEDTDPGALRTVAEALGLSPEDVGLEARELGRSGRLRPAFSDAGLRQLMVPVRSIEALEACRPRPDVLARVAGIGVYCFTAAGAGRVRARGLFPGAGVQEDPATGSAAGALGLYLADRIGDIDLQILQGREIGRPSKIEVEAERGSVRVGGACALVLKGTLEQLPAP
jgi:trans-2,3-dihydro-3-hydroxyanthranilate isomerase